MVFVFKTTSGLAVCCRDGWGSCPCSQAQYGWSSHHRVSSSADMPVSVGVFHREFALSFLKLWPPAERAITAVPGISTVTHLLQQPPLQACFSFPRHRLSLPGRRPKETDHHEVWLRRQYVPACLPDECSLLGTPDKNQWGAWFLTIYFWAGPKQASLKPTSSRP